MATLTSSPGTSYSMPGAIVPGGPANMTSSFKLGTMPRLRRKLLAHLYDNTWAFKSSLGSPLNWPSIKMALNAGYGDLEILLATLPSNVNNDDIVTLTEDAGDADGFILYGGLVEEIPDAIGTDTKTQHSLKLTPFVAELGDTYLNKNYTTPTDTGQMVRDAVALTPHCATTVNSVPNTGVLRINNFNNSSVKDVLDTAIRMTGTTYCWFCDAQGIVWFQAVGGAARYTFKRGADYDNRRTVSSSKERRRKIVVVGGIPSGQGAPLTGVYSTGSKQLFPNPSYPDLLDQNTLTAIANTLGGIFDRVLRTTQLELTAYSGRIVLGGPGMCTARLWEPAVDPYPESDTGAFLNGGYSSVYPILDVESDGKRQKLTTGDIPFSGNVSDFDYQISDVIRKLSLDVLAGVPMFVQNPDGGVGGAAQAGASGLAKWFLNSSQFGAQDVNGVTRLEMGLLGALGISAAGWKFRARDSGNNPIFDSDGLIKAMTLLGSTQNFSNSNTTGNGAWQAVSNSTVNFSLSRQATVFALSAASVLDPTVGDTGYNLYSSLLVDSSYNAANGPQGYNWQAADFQYPFVVVTLAAGSHSIAFAGNQTSGKLWNASGGYLYVFLLGS